MTSLRAAIKRVKGRLREISSLAGWARFAWDHPGCGWQLLRRRCWHAMAHQYGTSIRDPWGYDISTASEFFSYWGFFIERQLMDGELCAAIRSSDRPLVIDVGANAGVFAHCLYVMNKNVQIFAVEPQTEMVARIEGYAARVGANIRCVCAACSDRSGYATLHLGSMGDQTASLEEAWQRSHKVKRVVPLVTLDDLLPCEIPLLVKIDAEGHDCKVIMGGLRVVQRARFVLVESHVDRCAQNLLSVLGSGWQMRKVGALDYLFVNERVGTCK